MRALTSCNKCTSPARNSGSTMIKTKRIRPNKQSRWLTSIAFNTKQQFRMTLLIVAFLGLRQYYYLSSPFLESRIGLDSMTRALDILEENVTTFAVAATISTPPPSPSYFSTWKSNVRDKFLHQDDEIERKERKSSKNIRIQERYRALLHRLEKVADWSNKSSWTSVSPEAFQTTVQQARAEMKPLVDQVYADCFVWIVPFKAKTGQRRVYKLKPKLRFQCSPKNGSNLQDEPCDSTNLCLVRTDLRKWKGSKLNESSSIPYNVSLQNINFNGYGHLNKSAILSLVDSTDYLYSPRIWSCFLNKASFSLLTGRPFFIWIGKMDSEILHRRNTVVVKENFGATCDPFEHDKNAVNYYKPIAFSALFHRQQFVQVETAYFLDADIYFNAPAAFTNRKQRQLEDYFDLSPQASLLGSQNPSAKDQNILMNGGFLGLRRKSLNGNGQYDDEWINDFSALWWYCRCGERDQTALWLVLFAYWSAFSATQAKKNTPATFSYPGIVFENYDFAWYAVMPHSRRYLAEFQQSWQLLPSDFVKDNAGVMTPKEPSTYLFDGGKNFHQSTNRTEKTPDMLSDPLELPSVLLLPLDTFELKQRSSYSSEGNGVVDGVFPPLISKTKQLGEEGALLIHHKFPHNTCADQQCWPFVN